MERFKRTVMASALAAGITAGAVWGSKAVAAENPIKRDPSYTEAMSTLSVEQERINLERKRKEDAETAKMNAPIKPEVICADMDRICVKGADVSFTLDLTNYDDRMTVDDFRSILTEKQAIELDRLIAKIMTGARGKELIKTYEPVSETVAGLSISNSSYSNSELLHYMTPEQAKEFRMLMISLDSKNAEKLIAKYGERKVKEKKDYEEQKKQEERDFGTKAMTIFGASLLGLMYTMSTDPRRRTYALDVMENAAGTTLVGTGVGGMAGLLAGHPLIEMGWGFIAGSTVAAVCTLISFTFVKVNEKERKEMCEEREQRYKDEIKKLNG